MSRGASESDHVGVADGDDPVGRIVSELIEQFRSVGRPLRFYEVEEKMLDWVGKLRLLVEKLEKEKALLRERLEVMCNEKSALKFDVRKLQDCLQLSGVFSRLGEANAADMTGEEIYDAMLRKLMSGNGEDLTEVVNHLRRKVEELERDSQDSEVLKSNVQHLEGQNAELKRKWEILEGENAELKRKWEILEGENAELKKKWDELNIMVNEVEMENVDLKRADGDLRQRIVVLQMDNQLLTEKVSESSHNAMELKRMKDLNMAMLKVKAESSLPNYGELSRKIEKLKADNKDAELQYQTLKTELDESKRICKGLESMNEVLQFNFDELVQESEKMEKKISLWKKSYEELEKRVVVLEKDVDELKNGVCSVAGESTPISSRVVDLMESDDDVAVPVHQVEKRQSADSLGKEPLLTSRVELKRKSDKFIDLTQNEDNIDEGDSLCRSSSRARNV